MTTAHKSDFGVSENLPFDAVCPTYSLEAGTPQMAENHWPVAQSQQEEYSPGHGQLDEGGGYSPGGCQVHPSNVLLPVDRLVERSVDDHVRHIVSEEKAPADVGVHLPHSYSILNLGSLDGTKEEEATAKVAESIDDQWPLPVQVGQEPRGGPAQGWKFMSCSHCQELCQQASWLPIDCTIVNNQSEARSAS